MSMSTCHTTLPTWSGLVFCLPALSIGCFGRYYYRSCVDTSWCATTGLATMGGRVMCSPDVHLEGRERQLDGWRTSDTVFGNHAPHWKGRVYEYDTRDLFGKWTGTGLDGRVYRLLFAPTGPPSFTSVTLPRCANQKHSRTHLYTTAGQDAKRSISSVLSL
jgi:hypothetical protein